MWINRKEIRSKVCQNLKIHFIHLWCWKKMAAPDKKKKTMASFNCKLCHIAKGACSVESFVDFNACDLVLLRRAVRIRSLNDFTTVFFLPQWRRTSNASQHCNRGHETWITQSSTEPFRFHDDNEVSLNIHTNTIEQSERDEGKGRKKAPWWKWRPLFEIERIWG